MSKARPTLKYVESLIHLAKNLDLTLLEVDGIRIVPRRSLGPTPPVPAPIPRGKKGKKAAATQQVPTMDEARRARRDAEDGILFGRTYSYEDK